MSATTRARARRLAVGWLGWCTACTVLALYAVTGSLPSAPFHLPGASQLQTPMWVPEGWKFFSKSPRGAVHAAYVRDGRGAWRQALVRPNAQPANWFGANRSGRAQGVEMGVLLEHAPKVDWSECREQPATCLESALRSFKVKNRVPAPTLCGAVGVVMSEPVPWAWSSSAAHLTMPSHVLRMEVQC